ncbi:sigma factor [Microbacterium sp. BH-3-3-3]|uniref:sigma factor n=1 Tax=Microbacterium sp. BH-3-3-3 TaxID=1906742 RepID=UPI0037CBEDD3
MTDDLSRRVAAIWRIEGARIVATLARVVGDLPTAEDLAHDALLEALAQWPREGVPHNPGGWLTAVAKRRAIDGWRRERARGEKYRLPHLHRGLRRERRRYGAAHPWTPSLRPGPCGDRTSSRRCAGSYCRASGDRPRRARSCSPPPGLRATSARPRCSGGRPRRWGAVPGERQGAEPPGTLRPVPSTDSGT